MHASHCRKTTTDGWTLDQGLAAQYAAQAGLDPDLAAEAGEEVWDVLKSLRDATSEIDPHRQAKLVRRTKARLAKGLLSKAGLSRHGELVQHIEAKLLALQGRGGDTELAHLTPGEMIVPAQLQTPEVVQALHQAAHTAGIDLRRYTAGSSASSVNPDTGLEEYRFECVEGRNGPCGNIADPINTMTHRFIYDGSGRLSPNQPGMTSTYPGQFTGAAWQTGTGRFPGSGVGVFPNTQDPPGLVSNDGLPEEIEVSTNRFDAINRDLRAADDENLLWALRQRERIVMDWYWNEGGGLFLINTVGTLASKGDFIEEGNGAIWDSSWAAINKPFIDISHEINRRKSNGEWTLD